MTLDPELESNELIKASVETLATSVRNDLVREHNLDPLRTPDIRQSLFVGYSAEQMLGTF